MALTLATTRSQLLQFQQQQFQCVCCDTSAGYNESYTSDNPSNAGDSRDYPNIGYHRYNEGSWHNGSHTIFHSAYHSYRFSNCTYTGRHTSCNVKYISSSGSYTSYNDRSNSVDDSSDSQNVSNTAAFHSYKHGHKQQLQESKL